MKKISISLLVIFLIFTAVSCASTTRVESLENLLAEKDVALQEAEERIALIEEVVIPYFEGAVDDLEVGGAEAGKRIETLEIAIPNGEARIKALEAVVPVGTKRIEALEAVVPVVETRVGKLEESVDKLEGFIPVYNQVVDAIKNQYIPLKEEVVSRIVELAVLDQSIIDLLNKLPEM